MHGKNSPGVLNGAMIGTFTVSLIRHFGYQCCQIYQLAKCAIKSPTIYRKSYPEDISACTTVSSIGFSLTGLEKLHLPADAT